MALTSDTLAPRRGPPHRPPRPGLQRPPAHRAGRSAPLPPGDGPPRARADRLRERAHPQPRAARSSPASGPTTGPRCPAGCGAAARCSSTGTTRRRCVPVELHPLLRWRMAGDHAWGGMVSACQTSSPELARPAPGGGARARPGHARRARAPRRRHQAGQGARPGTCGTGAPAKKAVEWLFWQGEVSAVRNPQHVRAQLRRCPSACVPRDGPRGTDPDRRRRHEGAAAAGGAQPRRRHGPVPRRLPPPATSCTSRRLLAELAADGALRAVDGGGLEAPRLPPPRGASCPGGCAPRRSCRRSTRWCGSASAPRRCSTSATASRSTCPPPSGCTATTCSRSSTTAASSPASTSRPTARPARLRVRGAYAEPTWDDDKDLPAARRPASRSWPTFLGLADVDVEPQGRPRHLRSERSPHSG